MDSPLQGQTSDPDLYSEFNELISVMKGELSNATFHHNFDAYARKAYGEQIASMADKYTAMAERGSITWE